MRTANLKEWRGKTDDSKPPRSVRLRIFETHNGVCHLSKVKIQTGDKWELEHINAISLGGENRESNMAPALVEPHKAKTKADRATKAKNDHVRMKHIGILQDRKKIQSRGFAKFKPQRTASRPIERRS